MKLSSFKLQNKFVHMANLHAKNYVTSCSIVHSDTFYSCLYKTVPYKTVQYKTVRKSMKMNEKTVRYKTV